ncbi:MAG: hypothetical protein KatS3mg028_1303 [Bacteroidia bacterium]|nr:MAG: hypothetical protein KatS3mg028_1303 [Bacteroidia bacterium]
MDLSQLILKYNISVPRYTSYPPVPMWHHAPSVRMIGKIIWWPTDQRIKDQQGVSIYIHLPFCEQLCTYCGCNKRITVNHQVEEPYLASVLKEWAALQAIFWAR